MGYDHEHMGWATPYLEKLKRGESVQFRPRGNSMLGKIETPRQIQFLEQFAEHIGRNNS
jgi:hypothetical protein